jgi:hypothetical protein
MAKDLDLTGDRYDWLLTIFYISYIVVRTHARLSVESEGLHRLF